MIKIEDINWRRDSILIARGGAERILYVPSLNAIFKTDGKSTVKITGAEAWDGIERGHLRQFAAVPDTKGDGV